MKRIWHKALGTLGLLGLSMAQAAEPLPYAPIPTYVDDAPAYHDPGTSKGDHCWHVYGGSDALYLRPHFSSNPALTSLTTNDVTTTTGSGPGGLPFATVTNASSTTVQDFKYDFSVSPRIW